MPICEVDLQSLDLGLGALDDPTNIIYWKICQWMVYKKLSVIGKGVWRHEQLS